MGKKEGGNGMTREEALKQFIEYRESGFSKSEVPNSEALNMAIEALQNQPVRCRECKWFQFDSMMPDWYCKIHSFGELYASFESDDFCSFGEREVTK